jgi:O-acetylserine dependent cystathionine beta-synthase
MNFDLIGQTPLVLLESFSDENVQIYAKLEQFNPGGSVKIPVFPAVASTIVSPEETRPSFMAVSTRYLPSLSVIAANRYHLKCVIFAPEGFSEEKISIMRALGADCTHN